MKHDFFQFIVPIKKLIKVGEEFVPDGKDIWRIPVWKEISVVYSEDPFITSESPVAESLDYQRTFIGFIAKVEVKVEVK